MNIAKSRNGQFMINTNSMLDSKKTTEKHEFEIMQNRENMLKTN